MVPDHADPAGRLIAASLTLRDFRSYAALDLDLDPGLVLVTGPNGAGKTNLLESLHVGTQGFSPRTRADAQLIRFGTDTARVTVRGDRAGVPVEAEVTVSRARGKTARLNGAGVSRAEELRAELTTLAFTPDRLAVVKGGPAVRRAYFDRTLGRLLPAQASLPAAYGEAVGQRNASLRRVRLGLSDRDALAPWTAQVAALAAELVTARHRLLELVSAPFARCARALGLGDATLEYRGEPPTAADLDARLERDLERGATGLGPHLDEIAILAAGARELRTFGSQGEQRLAVLSLILAEAELIAAARPGPPLLLLDDVLSELDDERRGTLTGLLPADGQTVITAADPNALPIEPAVVIRVEPGRATRA